MRKFLAPISAGLCLLTGAAAANEADFNLLPNPAFVDCLSGGGSTPQAAVVVLKGTLNDRLTIRVWGLKPNLDFDLFTVQRSPLDAGGNTVPNFKGFGLAWYQSDLHSNENGEATATIRTILLNQIFGFDADKLDDGTTRVPPTNTFHVGFWFNNPNDAASCGFDTSKPTPFNGEHKAGPLAMISTPVAPANLGPLCIDPTGVSEDDASKDSSGLTLTCNP